MLQNKKYMTVPIILATQEAELRRIGVRSQPRQTVWETLSQKNPSQKKAGGVAQGVAPILQKISTWLSIYFQYDVQTTKLPKNLIGFYYKHQENYFNCLIVYDYL
jgi:hypothetical protein